MMPSGHKAFLVHNARDMDMLLMHNQTYAAECVLSDRMSFSKSPGQAGIVYGCKAIEC